MSHAAWTQRGGDRDQDRGRQPERDAGTDDRVARTYEEQTSKFLRAGALIYKLYHGKAFTPPGFGGRASAFTATRGPYRGAIGIWYNETAFAYVTIGITTSRVKHAPAALEAIAATAVPNFGF